MTEKKIIVPTFALRYTGIFKIKDVQDTINRFMHKHGYSIDDLNTSIQATSTSKTQGFNYVCNKDLSEWDLCRIKVNCQFSNLETVSVHGPTGPEYAQKGNVVIDFFAVTRSERQQYVTHRPFKYVLAVVFNSPPFRYFLHSAYNRFISQSYLKDPGAGLEDQVKSLHDELYLMLKQKSYVVIGEKHG